MGSSLRTPYEILGVPSNADSTQLRHAYRNHIHGLKQGHLSSTVYREICRAYECLSDDNKRKKYDEEHKWIYKLSIENYTLQQLASEPILISNLKDRLDKVTLREINAQDSLTGHTALYCAARAGNINAVLYLIEKGAEPDLGQRTKSTALHVSAYYGHPEIVRCLLESGADYRIKNGFNSTAEDESYNNDVKQVFNELKQTPFVQTAADQVEWFKQNINNLSQHIDEQYYVQRQTLLHCASKKGYLELVRWLIEQRYANLDIVDINLNSALHLASYSGHTSVVEYLINRSANPLLINKWNMTAEQEGEHFGITIRQIFDRIRQCDMFEMATNGIDWWFEYYFDNHSPNSVDINGTSLLYIACRYGQILVAKWLLDHGANVNKQLEQGTGSTPLHGAAYYGHVSTIELLLSYGADVNIKNNFGATVFDEDKPNHIKLILEQYRRNLKNDKLMPIFIYQGKLNTNNKDEPIVKIHLSYNAKQNDLYESLPDKYRNYQGYFSIGKRPLYFEKDDTNILTAVCYSRYVRSKFIEIPLRLTYSIGKLPLIKYDKTKIDLNFNYLIFEENFERQSQNSRLKIISSIDKEQTYRVGDLSFSIPAGSNNKKVLINIQYINVLNFPWNSLPGCVCLFKLTYESRTRLKEPPIVSFLNQPNVRLYTLGSPTFYWFTYDTRQKRLPLIEGIHAFFRHVDIIPKLLSLPADMFISMMIEQPLINRDTPIPCKCLQLRPHDTLNFPYIAYHGTRIDVIQSILIDGLVVPGTLVSNGIRVKPPANHIPLYTKANNIPNFAGAIFVSPSIYYCLDPVYATSFEYEGRRLLPLLECSVKFGSFTTHRSTLPLYIPHPTDDLNVIEWRIDDPINLEINAILFVIKEFDRRKKT